MLPANSWFRALRSRSILHQWVGRCLQPKLLLWLYRHGLHTLGITMLFPAPKQTGASPFILELHAQRVDGVSFVDFHSANASANVKGEVYGIGKRWRIRGAWNQFRLCIYIGDMLRTYLFRNRNSLY
jgi:hypothetical protein